MKKCRICSSIKIKKIFSLHTFPIFIGCTDDEKEQDILYDFDIWHCEECDVGQQIDIPPFEELYREQRCFGFGKTWQEHYKKYAKFIEKNSKQSENALEVGVGNAIVFKKLNSFFNNLEGLDAIDNPEYRNYKIKVGIFSEDMYQPESFDLIYSSHFIEHLPDPVKFLKTARKLLKENGRCVIACPNIIKSFENLHFNAFTTDHLNYFSKDSLENIGIRLGYELIDFYQYLDHGMYLVLKKINNKKNEKENKRFIKKFEEFNERILEYVNKAKKELENHESAYVFGAHGLTVTFLKILNDKKLEEKIKFVLDNEVTKHQRRLCGTSLFCKPPIIIKDEKKPLVLLYMGAYENEISQQLKEINPNCNILNSK